MADANAGGSKWCGANATCVLLGAATADGGAAETAAASRWLESQGWRIVPVADPLEAMSAMCLLERAQASRAAWGLTRADEIALMIANAAMEEAGTLRDAIARHLPDARVWIWPNVASHASRSEASDESAGGEEELHPRSVRIGAPPLVRTNGTRGMAAPDHEVAAAGEAHEITRREIAMLLDLDGVEDQR